MKVFSDIETPDEAKSDGVTAVFFLRIFFLYFHFTCKATRTEYIRIITNASNFNQRHIDVMSGLVLSR